MVNESLPLLEMVKKSFPFLEVVHKFVPFLEVVQTLLHVSFLNVYLSLNKWVKPIAAGHRPQAKAIKSIRRQTKREKI